MNIVNEDIIIKILSTKHNPNDIKVSKWDIKGNIIQPGNNATSEVYRLTIDYTIDGETLQKHIFIKVPHNTTTHTFFKNINIYDKEAYLYTRLFPQIYSTGEEYFTPRNYYVGDGQSLFLKDISQCGYKMANRIEQLDFEHCYHALRCLGKWHAYTVKLYESGNISQFLKTCTVYNKSNQNEFMHSIFISGVEPFINNLEPIIRKKYAKQLNVLKSLTWDKFVNDMAPRSDSFNVLLHGDFATVNMMFKYDKYRNVKKVKLIDFQLSRWTSPAVDLIQFMVLAMKYEVYEKHFDLLLQIYLDTLNKTLRGLGSNITFEMDALKKDIEQRYMYTFGLVTSTLPIILKDPREVSLDFKEILQSGHFDPDVKNQMFQQPRHVQTATKWFLHYVQKGIFDSENE